MSDTTRVILDVEVTCRMCLCSKSADDLLSLLENNLAYAIQDTFNIELVFNSNFPTVICTRCLKCLNDALAFRKQIIQSEAQLREAMIEMGPDQQSTVIYEFEDCEGAKGGISVAGSELGDEVLPAETELEDCRNSNDTKSLEGTRDICSITTNEDNEFDCFMSDGCIKSLEARKQTEEVPNVSPVEKEAPEQEVHEQKREKVINFRCDFCFNTFRFEFLHRKHLLKHGIFMKCEICSQTFQEANDYLLHAKTIHADHKPFACPRCDKRFHSISPLKLHFQTHSVGPKKFQCDKCGKEYAQSRALTIHKRMHGLEASHKCGECHKILSSRHSLRNHLKIHQGIKNYKCDICGAAFIHRFSLREHLRTHTGEKPYRCKICDGKFSTASYLKIHLRYHSSEKPYQCPLCSKSFVSKSSLSNHQQMHKGVKNYQCDICGFQSTRRADLQTHIRKHTGEKPYCCYECGKRYKTASNLAYHKRSHVSQRTKYTCTMCNRVLGDPRSLRVHIRIHTGEMPYQCDICGSRFRQSGRLSTHRKIHNQST